MKKTEFKKAEDIVVDSLEQTTVLLDKLLSDQDEKHSLFVLEGALHAVIHMAEHLAPSGLYSTQFVVGALNDILLAQIQGHREVESALDDTGSVH